MAVRSNIVQSVSADEQWIPPQAVEVEEEVLGGLMFDPTAILRVEGLEPDAFYLTAHREIYRAILALYQAEQPIDLMTVARYLADRDLLDKVGGQPKLANLLTTTVHAINIDYLASILMDKLHRRRLIAAANEIARTARDNSLPIHQIQSDAEEKIFSLSASEQQQGLEPIGSVLMDEFNRVEAVFTGRPDMGIRSGFYDLDALTQGYRRHQLIVVAGRPSMGKSSWALANVRNIAAQGYPVAVFSLEMGREEIGQILWAAESRIEAGRILSGRVSEADWIPLSDSLAKLSALPIYVDRSTSISPVHILSQCRRLKAKIGQLGLIVVDYLQLMVLGDDQNQAREVGKITRALKLLAMQLKVPVMALSQLSRQVESRADKRPMMSDLRDSGRIEEDADIVLMLYRDEYYNPESSARGIAEVLIRKNRGGATGGIKLLFEPEYRSFKNLTQPSGR